MAKRKIFVDTAPQPKATSFVVARYILTGLIVLMLLAQLFTFEDFPDLIVVATGLGVLPSKLIAGFIVILELMSLPFLISLKTLPRVRQVSLVCLGLTLVLLSALEIINSFGGQAILFGATFSLPAGTWAVTYLLALCILAAWVFYGEMLTKSKSLKFKTKKPKAKNPPS